MADPHPTPCTQAFWKPGTSGAMSVVETIALALNATVSLVVVAVLSPAGSAAVHLNPVVASTAAVQCVPCPAAQPASGPALTVAVHLKWPSAWPTVGKGVK